MFSFLKSIARPSPHFVPPEHYGIGTRERQRRANRPPSFTDQLPWMDYDADSGAFILEDGRSRGLLYELIPTPTEARSDDFLQKRCEEIQAALSSLPEADDAEWIVQIYVNDDDNIEALGGQVRQYILDANAGNPARAQEILHSAYTQAYLKELDEHFKAVSNPAGFFHDETVSGNIWRAQQRRVRCVLYRRFPPKYDSSHEVLDPVELLNQVGEGFVASLREAGVQARRANGKDFYEWLFPFFNRRADFAGSAADLLRKCPYSGDDTEDRPFGWDFSEQLTLSMPLVDCEEGIIEFDGAPVRALTLQSLKRKPQIGHFTAERRHDDKLYARFDRLPAGSMLSVTIVVRAQDVVKQFVQTIADASRAKTADARYTAAEAGQVMHRMACGDKLFPMFMTLYVRGEDRVDLRKRVAAVNAQLHACGLKFIEPRHDIVGVDAFLRGLPMNFDPAFDMRHLKRSRFAFVSQIAALLPLYGRARGSGRPGFIMWNRGGEALCFDPLNPRDRKKNAHLLMMGPTGAGKSATGVKMVMEMLAIYRPRLIVAEVGGSFDLFGDHCRKHGLTVNKITLSAGADVSLPPFADAYKLLDESDVIAGLSDVDEQEEADDSASGDDEPEKRDLLGEMVITARLMITGGEEAEIARMTRADRYVIAKAILNAARATRSTGRPHPRAEDVARAMIDMRDDPELGPERRSRAEEMGQSMMVFCDRDLRGRLFNRDGAAWPDADVTIVNLATLAQEGYEDALAVAYIGLMNHTQALAERTQYDARPIIFVTDEGHIITTNPLLSPYAVKITKMWRKLGTWFWLFTQNMKDFPDQASRILNMCEWWLLLTMDTDEIEQVARFRTLTPEQRKLMESATKEPPKYTEGVILSATQQALFRNVPPALPIALAMTEKHEKAERRKIMEQLGVTELGAAAEVAKRMVERRG